LAQPDALKTYTRTISTMGEVLDTLRDEPDPSGALTMLADRIAVEREWVRTLMALGEEPCRPPGWLRGVELASR
jgi:phage tail tape-measure protein